MKTREKATSKTGDTVEFVVDSEKVMEGGMKHVYFTPDKSSVVCFFKDQTDINRLARLEAVVGRFNPTLDSRHGTFWKDRFCWPTSIVQSQRYGLGITAPAYPSKYIFRDGPLSGREKEGGWFLGKEGKFRDMMPPTERGDFSDYLKICMNIARSVRRLHMAGLAHSDLSRKNVLVDPSSGEAIVIDIDSLVVPQVFPPDVLGTAGYIAPEVLATHRLPMNDPKRCHACTGTDQHALAVLIYEYLLLRHPLKGPRRLPAATTEEEEMLEMGAKALFIEHPADTANHRPDITVPCSELGPVLHSLFLRAFVDGLHAPHKRPAAIEWERALYHAYDHLCPCSNPACAQRWFILHDPKKPVCPWCRTRVKTPIPLLKFRSERRPGQWVPDGELVGYNNGNTCNWIYQWHVFEGASRAEGADKTPLAYFTRQQGCWVLANDKLTSLHSPAGNLVARGSGIGLNHGVQFRLAAEQKGRIAEVELISV